MPIIERSFISGIVFSFIRITCLCTIVFLLFSTPSACQKFQWAHRFGSTNIDWGTAVAVDAFGNVYTTGLIWGAADFDPGPDTAFLSSAELMDIFVCKFDPQGNLLWARILSGSGGGGWTGSRDAQLAVEPSGTVFVAGSFSDTTDFDPGSAEHNVIPENGGRTGFVLKLTAAGEFVWVMQLAGAGRTSVGCIVLDKKDHFYVTGTFMNSCDFDPGGGQYLLTEAVGESSYAAKYDLDGNLLWARKLEGKDMVRASAIAVNKQGGVYVTGSFVDTADFDPGAGMFQLASEGWTDIFICKLNEQGTFDWAKSFGGWWYDEGAWLGVDAAGNVYATGCYMYSADFDPGPNTAICSTGSSPAQYLLKLSAAGDFVWVNSVQAPVGDYRAFGLGLCVDTYANVYTTGFFSGNTDFDGGNGQYLVASNMTTSAWDDVFVSKYDSTGQVLWAGAIGGMAGDHGQSVAVDPMGNVFVAGIFEWWADFDPGPGMYKLYTAGIEEAFIVKLGPPGTGLNASVGTEPVSYPNPSSGIMNISLSEPSEMALSNPDGRVVYRKHLPEGVNTFALPSSLAPGLYIYEVVGKNRKGVGKVYIKY